MKKNEIDKRKLVFFMPKRLFTFEPSLVATKR